MASSPFERQVAEAGETEDRSTATPAMSDAPQQYEPSPSFLDHDRPGIRLVELPAWLQSFASSVGEPSEEDEAPSADQDMTSEEPVSTPDDQNEPEADAASTAQSARPSGSSNVSSDFISEDDLPDWLRSIAPEESVEPGADPFERTVGTDELTVPNVSRAWTTSKDARGIDEATSLFALVASQTPQTALPGDDPGPAQAGRDGSPGKVERSGNADRSGAESPPVQKPRLEFHSSVEVEPEAAAPAPALPIIPIAVAAILLIVLIAAAVFFVL